MDEDSEQRLHSGLDFQRSRPAASMTASGSCELNFDGLWKETASGESESW